MNVITAIKESENFSDIDYHLARFMMKHAGSEPELAALSAALVSAELSAGHICLNLERGKGLIPENDADKFPLPSLKKWRSGLIESGMAGDGSHFTPLVLEENRLYLQRYWQYEEDIARILLERSCAPGETLALEEENLLEILFPGGEDNLQRRAAAMALSGRLAVISGGPGTGKTTTLARFLYIMLSRDPDTRIALGAPTGKAAARMNEAIAVAREQLDEIMTAEKRPVNHEAVMEQMGSLKGRTLHRMLGYLPRGGEFRHNRENPLLQDIVVIDEASMIDCSLMAKLCRALPPETRLVLLGDRDQLASVEAGAILGDICESALDKKGPLRGHVIELKESWRFRHRTGIGALAETINRGGSPGDVKKVFSDYGKNEGISLLDVTEGKITELFRDRIIEEYRKVVEAPDPESALAAMKTFRILAPLRRGPEGVNALNQLAERVLRESGLIRGGSGMYRDRPVMVTRNSYQLSLFNGDIGIVREDDNGNLRIYFPAPDGFGVRSVLPAMMPPHETVFAMTVHKSQGSEFDHVILVLPRRDSPVVTRELLYTGITRARNLVEIAASQETIQRTINCRVERSSGLEYKLVPSPLE